MTTANRDELRKLADSPTLRRTIYATHTLAHAAPALLDALDQAEARIQAVRELHLAEPGTGPEHCIDCEQPLPCATIRALDGHPSPDR